MYTPTNLVPEKNQKFMRLFILIQKREHFTSLGARTSCRKNSKNQHSTNIDLFSGSAVYGTTRTIMAISKK